MKEIKKIVEKIDGWLSGEEGKLLYNLARNCKGNGVIVEVGSWKGKSTVWLGKGSKGGSNVKIYAVDPHSGSSEIKESYGEIQSYEDFKSNIKKAKIDDIIVPIVKTSEEAAKNFDEPIELIFIDGAHEYDFVKLDFELWFPKVIKGGIMVFHDTVGYDGPKNVIKKYIFNSKNFRKINFVDSITYAEKTTQNSAKDRLRNQYIFFLKCIYDFGYGLNLPQPLRIIGRKLAKLIQ